MSLSTSGFYTRLCDDWDDVVGESLAFSFDKMMEEIKRACDEINNHLNSASAILDRACGTYASAVMPVVPAV